MIFIVLSSLDSTTETAFEARLFINNGNDKNWNENQSEKMMAMRWIDHVTAHR